MYQLKIGSVPMPKLYICDKEEAGECRKLGIPYIIKPSGWSDEKLVKAVLWRTLANKFPKLKWDQMLRLSPYEVQQIQVFMPASIEVKPKYRCNKGVDSEPVSDSSMQYTKDAEYRETDGGCDPEDTIDWEDDRWESTSMVDYIGDLQHYVNIEELQTLRLLPVFLDDIANAIKVNLSNTAWIDGYNKKLGCNLGNWNGGSQAPNLIILDVSGSIPSGVAYTMIALIETLRHQANADLIITSGRSEYWPANSSLPRPEALRVMIGGCNECTQFYEILRKHILGRHWGNVIVFGDQDSPLREDIQERAQQLGKLSPLNLRELQSTKIDRIMAFHTYASRIPGYGLWAKDASPKAEVVFNTEWRECM